MAEGRSRKVVVEVCNARNLLPKDGQGTSSPYALVDFDGQRRRTKTKPRDLNPQWDERLEFLVNDPDSMATETLELNLYNDKKSGKRSTFLGRVRISGGTFPTAGSESLVYYPLEKRSVFSQVKGEIGLKLFYVDDDPAPASATPEKPSQDEKSGEKPPAEEEKKTDQEKKQEDHKEEPPKKAEDGKEKKPPEDAKKEDPPPEKKSSDAEKPSEEEEKKKKAEDEKPAAATSPAAFGVSDVDIPSLGERSTSTYDLVERMPFLYVRVLKAKGDFGLAAGSSIYAKVVVGSQSIRTRSSETPEWDQVFAFHKDKLDSTSLEVSVLVEKSVDGKSTETCLGTVAFELQEVPKRAPPDSPLAPQWHTLEGVPNANDVMLAVWLGTQADEAFPEAWQSDSGGQLVHTRSKVYLSPKLWYLRLTVIQTQDLRVSSSQPDSKGRPPELYVKAQLGSQVFKTTKATGGFTAASANPSWNEDLVFVAAEPFEPFLVVAVENSVTGQAVGQFKLPVAGMEKRMDDRLEPRSKWFNLSSDDAGKQYAGRIHVRACLEGGYHVLDEATYVTSDVRATAKQLWKPPIGSLEVGILGATNLLPMKTKDGTRGTADAYCVAKYGRKWVRTRTILDHFSPRWNEQYTWEVYDPSTVLTVAVFDNSRYKEGDGKDARIGKIRIRLSTLETNRVYTKSYALTVLQSSGAKQMGELELAIRFSCSSWVSLMQAYVNPILPRMHYARPLTPVQQDALRHVATRIVTARLGRAEPPLGHEVVNYMLDSDTHVWSLRRSKANWFRIMAWLKHAASLVRWVDEVRTWSSAGTTVLVHALYAILVFYPHLILPTLFLYLFFILIWRFRVRRFSAGNMELRLSCVDAVSIDELDEEFDSFPTARSAEQVKMRYDRLRALAGRAQTLLGDIAAQGERMEALASWRDPRATAMFAVFCLLTSLLLYAVPFKVVALFGGFYFLRHPRFRSDLPPASINFFRRLPSLSDRIL
ncbi:QUIRKY protein [Nymphaea thermarum]|nr:QUIRKY protein [Nymphaea thermarum]